LNDYGALIPTHSSSNHGDGIRVPRTTKIFHIFKSPMTLGILTTSTSLSAVYIEKPAHIKILLPINWKLVDLSFSSMANSSAAGGGSRRNPHRDQAECPAASEAEPFIHQSDRVDVLNPEAQSGTSEELEIRPQSSSGVGGDGAARCGEEISIV
jgi:hypothetical protein